MLTSASVANPMLDRLRLFLSHWIFSPLQGTTLRVWLQALSQNRFRVPPRFWPRALVTTASAAVNSVNAGRQRRRYENRVRDAEVESPVFILGHYRSGTTHLHNLLASDPGLAYPDNFQANFPRTFLVTESSGKRLGSLFTMRKRPHDNVELSLEIPTEDELALCADTLLSPHMGWHFPRRREHYERRYLTFDAASDEERRRWIESLRTFAAKLTVRHGDRLVLKSPLHTARIPLLLESFPDARFIHVHRDPFRVFLSTRNMERKVEPLFRYQASDRARLDERILWRYRTMMSHYLEHRDRVPYGRLVEVGYEELTREPLATLEEIYRRLDLRGFGRARPRMKQYLRSVAGYRKNVYPALEPETRERIAAEWGFAFRAWGYGGKESG